MPFDLAPLGPSEGFVMVVDIDQQQARCRAMDDQADVGVDAGRPEVWVSRASEFVELKP